MDYLQFFYGRFIDISDRCEYNLIHKSDESSSSTLFILTNCDLSQRRLLPL